MSRVPSTGVGGGGGVGQHRFDRLNVPPRRSLFASNNVLRSFSHGDGFGGGVEQHTDALAQGGAVVGFQQRFGRAQFSHGAGEVAGEGADDNRLGQGGGFDHV
jgi:hypothetical protein